MREGYRIIFSDLDGTLLDPHQQIGEETVGLVQELAARGIPFVPVSARMPRTILPITRRLGVEPPMVCFNGGLLKDASGRTIAGNPVSREVVARALATIEEAEREFGIAIAKNLYTEDQWLTEEPESIQALHEAEVVGMQPTRACFREVLQGEAPIYKLSCCTDFRQEFDTKRLEKRLSEALPELAVHCSAGWYLELSDAKATKGSGLIRMCELLGYPVAQSIAFGDNYNDLDMLAAAGLGVAMANAPQEVREAADAVTERTNEEEGLARELRARMFG